MKLTEREWAEQNSQKYQGDAQAYYLAQFHAWRRGEIDMALPTTDMLDAWEAEAISFRKSITEPQINIF